MNAPARLSSIADPPLPDPWQSAPLPAAVAAELRALLARLDSGQRLWLSGFLAGSAAAPTTGAPAAAAATAAPITVLFGTHTGNSERLARRIAASLDARGLRYELLDMLDCRKTHLQGTRSLLAIVSTHGDGDPPERAQPLFELLGGRRAPRLEQLRFAVLALGDSSYEKFCASGRELDARLETLGAVRLQPRLDCDLDFDAPASRWIEAVVDRLASERTDGVAPGSAPTGAEARGGSPVASAHTRKNPFPAPVLANERLTAAGSSKDVRHVELSIEGANFHYEPGDALGVLAFNREEDVEAVLATLPYSPQTEVLDETGAASTLREALARRQLRAPRTGEWLAECAPGLPGAEGLGANEWLARLRPLAPRLYSIASSQRRVADEVHLAVSVVEYHTAQGSRRGLVSGAIAASAAEATLPVYLHRNPGFRLPADPTAAVVMIGPGTGVAPFRAFLQEREALGASGRNWLFFGDRSFETDFLYQSEWIDWRKRGLLTRVDVAFSRDRGEKTYVQHRLAERGAELWSWLEEGAYLYVCGDAERMAPDVHRTLVALIARHGRLDAEAAEEHLLELQRARRYQRDVY